MMLNSFFFLVRIQLEHKAALLTEQTEVWIVQSYQCNTASAGFLSYLHKQEIVSRSATVGALPRNIVQEFNI